MLSQIRLLSFILGSLFVFAGTVTANQEKQMAPPKLPDKIININKDKPRHLVDKYTWISNIKKEIPEYYCQDDKYFMLCFNVDKSTCMKFTDIYLTACLDNITPKLPSKMSSKDSDTWGHKIMYCSTDLYSKFMGDKRKNTDECQPNVSTENK